MSPTESDTFYLAQIGNGYSIKVFLCRKCNEEAFSQESWMKLWGAHAGSNTADVCYDGEFTYVCQALGDATIPSKRGPILRLRFPVGKLLNSTSCGFCKVLKDLDVEQDLTTKQFKEVQVDLQLFYPTWSKGTLHPFLIQVTTKAEVPLAQRLAGDRDRVNSTFLGLIPEKSDDEALGTAAQGAGRHPFLDGETPEVSISAYGLESLRTWIQECEANHTQCALSKHPRLPMRVIHVLPSGSTDHVRLVETMDRPHGRYVALSYVWGSKHSIRLVHATRSSFIQGIAIGELPKTLQDAVQVTRSLGISYLWIDALCILQDSESDKDIQIPYMNRYYRGAIVVISASGAADVHAGFLQPQQTRTSVLARAESQSVARCPERGPVPNRIPCYFPRSDDMFLFSIKSMPRLYSHDNEPINKRGWTLQESALARRLLIFPSTGGIVMRCYDGTKLAGEILSNPFHEDPSFTYPEAVDCLHRSQEELSNRWGEIVQDYSRRSLSQPGDILVALGALALETHIRDGVVLGRYLAGLWTNTLLPGLLWHVSEILRPSLASFWTPPSVTSPYHASSWSWASCGKPVVFRSARVPHLDLPHLPEIRDAKPSWCIEILQSKVFLQSDRNPFGAVATGYLDIKGSLLPLRRIYKVDDVRSDIYDIGDIALLTGKDDGNEKAVKFIPDSIESLALINSSCYWLPVYNATLGQGRGLIVREIIPGRFCRLGFAQFHRWERLLEGSERRVIRLN